MNNKYLIVKLDQYAGNVDEIVCVALTGSGNDRYGSMQAKKLFDAKVRPLLNTDSDYPYPKLPIGFYEFATEYGMSSYELDSEDSLRMKIDNSAYKNIVEMLDIWDKAYRTDEGHLEIVVEGIHNETVTVRILGFELVEVVETRQKLC